MEFSVHMLETKELGHRAVIFFKCVNILQTYFPYRCMFPKVWVHFLCLKGFLELFCVSLLARNSFRFYVSVFMELVRFELGCHQMWGMSATVAADVISDPFPMSSFCRGSNQRYPGC